MAQRGRKKIPGTRTRSKKKDVDGNYLRGRPSFDPSTPPSNDGKQLEQMVESISFSEFKAPFNRDKLPELYRELEDPVEALRAYIRHMVLALTPRDLLNVYAYRVCSHKNIVQILHEQVLAEMTFDFRSQDKIQLEGYFKQILESGMHATGGAYLQAGNFVLRTYKTIFMVVGSTGSMSYVSSLYNGGVEYFYAYHPGLATFYNRDNSAGQHYITNTGGSFIQANVNHTFEYDGVIPTLYRSSSNVAGYVTGAATADNYTTGSFSLFSSWAGGYPSTMQILEVLVYNKALNSTERTQVWDYLTSRYGT